MHVAMLIARSDIIGGANVVVADLCAGLVDEGIQTTVLAGGNGPYFAHLDSMGVRTVSIPSLGRAIRPWRDLSAFVELRQAIKSLTPDLISCHAAKAGFLGRLVAAGLGIPATYTAHGWSFDEGVPRSKAALYRNLERLGATLPGTVIDVCEHDRRVAASAGVRAKDGNVVVRNGVPDIDSSELADAAGSPPTIVMVARFEPQKDQLTLLEALAGLTEKKWSAQLVGEGRLREAAEHRVRELGLIDRVSFLGAVNGATRIMASAQIFALASNWEGLPISILEAMRAGLALVATDIGGVSEAITNGRDGMLVPRGDVSAMRDALASLIDDASVRATLGSRARTRFEAEFRQDRMVAQTAEVYRSVLSRSGGKVAGAV
jgi:glycosyltransferase involved in cell wall biosynthesis